MKKIIIVEDDEKLRKELQIFLQKHGYAIKIIEEMEEPVQEIVAEKVDLILLDINLPHTDGEYLLKEIRKISEVPIMMMTSKDNELDELICMNYGADQYVTKPFNLQILLAKIAALLRRTGQITTEQNKMNCGQFILNLSKSQLEAEDNIIALTKNELKIIHFLVQKRGQIVSREEIMADLWDSESFIDDNTLTVNMTRLRNKLEELGLKDLIETKRGQGYLLKDEE